MEEVQNIRCLSHYIIVTESDCEDKQKIIFSRAVYVHNQKHNESMHLLILYYY